MSGRCPACGTITPSGSNCLLTDTDWYEWTAGTDGTVDDPHTLDPILSADVDQLLTCGAGGLLALVPTAISNPPAVQAYNTTNLSIANNTLTVVTCNTELYDTDTMHCVDQETEVLTGRGWLSYDQLTDRDELLTLNHQTGLSEWQPMTRLHVYEARPRMLTLMEGNSHSSLTTGHHRWPVLRARFGTEGKKRPLLGYERLFATTSTLSVHDRIPTAAACADLPTLAKWDDDFVELVAWFWTEGTFANNRPGSPGNTGVIVQSYKAHPELCDRIRGVLTRLYGPAVESFGRQGSRHDGVPRWKIHQSARDTYAFTLNAPVGKMLREVLLEKIPTLAWLRSLTRAQLELFIQVSLLADNSGESSVGQKSKRAAEAFQYAVILSGRASSLRMSPGRATPDGPGRFDGITVPDMWHARSLRKSVLAPRMAAHQNRAFVITQVRYDGPVWCPEVPNQTWLARRKGSVYFTGNSTSSNTGRVTFTTAGTYAITFNCAWNKNSTGDRTARIRKNGTDTLTFESKDSGGADLIVGHCLTLIDLFVATDYIEGLVQQTSGAALLLLAETYSPILTATRMA